MSNIKPSGRMSAAHREFILKQTAEGVSPEEIAKKINRNVETVQEYIKKNYIPDKPPTDAKARLEVEKVQIRKELRESQKWKWLRQELTEEELRFFEEEYTKLIAQFKGDILPTEESQIFDVLKFEILKRRNMYERKRCLEDIERMEESRDEFIEIHQGEDLSNEDRNYLLNLETQIQAAKSAEQSRSVEFTKLQQESNALWKTLKGTRDQRIKQIENSKITFLGIIKALQERDMQEKEGRQLELLKMAGEKEKIRLGTPTEYADGTWDRPILNSETIEIDELEDN